MWWKLRELLGNFLEAQANPLGEHDECDSPQYFARESSLRMALALRAYEPALLVESESRCRDSASPRYLADCKQFSHHQRIFNRALDFKFT